MDYPKIPGGKGDGYMEQEAKLWLRDSRPYCFTADYLIDCC